MKTRIYYQKTTNFPMDLSNKENFFIQAKTFVREDKHCPIPTHKKETSKDIDKIKDVPWFDF